MLSTNTGNISFTNGTTTPLHHLFFLFWSEPHFTLLVSLLETPMRLLLRMHAHLHTLRDSLADRSGKNRHLKFYVGFPNFRLLALKFGIFWSQIRIPYCIYGQISVKNHENPIKLIKTSNLFINLNGGLDGFWPNFWLEIQHTLRWDGEIRCTPEILSLIIGLVRIK